MKQVHIKMTSSVTLFLPHDFSAHTYPVFKSIYFILWNYESVSNIFGFTVNNQFSKQTLS